MKDQIIKSCQELKVLTIINKNMFTKTIVKEVIDETKIKELQQEIVQIKKDFQSDKRILEAELQTKITQSLQVKVEENNKIKEENSVLKKEVEILEKAFENMGFDVKDMKEILNKLVDGIVSKNEINVIK
jgi:hypothetical protein